MSLVLRYYFLVLFGVFEILFSHNHHSTIHLTNHTKLTNGSGLKIHTCPLLRVQG